MIGYTTIGVKDLDKRDSELKINFTVVMSATQTAINSASLFSVKSAKLY